MSTVRTAVVASTKVVLSQTVLSSAMRYEKGEGECAVCAASAAVKTETSKDEPIERGLNVAFMLG